MEADRAAFLRDTDVLDTWFSSALWPFSTLGWPDQTPELKRYYPTSVLSTAFDIIFFWVARMMMMGLHFMDDVPFHTVFIHTRVLDEKGAKMSKTKGNVVDPIDIVDELGADALRFTLALAAGTGRDMRIGPSRVEPNRNFGTKLWNATRFCEMNQCVTQPGFDPAKVTLAANQWIVAETAQAASDVTAQIANLKFNEASATVYHFVYDVFCDWYLEICKPVFNGTDAAAQAETRATAAWARDQLLKLLHPFMPFITEELWARTAEGASPRDTLLIEAPWPDYAALPKFEDAARELNWVIDLVKGVRSIRAEMNVPPSAKIALLLKDANATSRARLARQQGGHPPARAPRHRRTDRHAAQRLGAVRARRGDGRPAARGCHRLRQGARPPRKGTEEGERRNHPLRRQAQQRAIRRQSPRRRPHRTTGKTRRSDGDSSAAERGGSKAFATQSQ